MLLEIAARDVLSRYNVPRGTFCHLGSHGGFSGAQLWRIDAPAGNFALKAWPADWGAPAQLTWTHGLMTQAASLPWMPRVVAADDGATFVPMQGRLWEIVTWMPGRADFDQAPSTVRLQAAATALAQLHEVWTPAVPYREVCPAVLRRLLSWHEWTRLLQSGWRPTFAPLDPFQAHAVQLWRLSLKWIDDVPRLLNPWLTRPVAVQPCVCDLWHDHVLFTGAAVTGLIDFGSVKIDHVAVDLARLFGSLIGDDTALWEAGFSAYERTRSLTGEERELAHVLDRTGVIIAATNWLRWLYHEGRVYENRAAVNSRLAALLRRLEGLA